MPSWETIGIIAGSIAGFIAFCAVIGVVGSWFVTESIKTIRYEWDKADPRRKEKEDE